MDKWEGITIKQNSPVGTLFVTIYQDKHGSPLGIILNIGKAGGEVVAWAQALCDSITINLQLGVSLPTIVDKLRGNTSHRAIIDLKYGTMVRSGIEGLALALQKYLDIKSIEDDESRKPGWRRPPSMAV